MNNQVVSHILKKLHQPRDHQHFAVIVPVKRYFTGDKIIYGENRLIFGSKIIKSVHAEVDAIDEYLEMLGLLGIRLPIGNKKKIIVDLWSIRLSKTKVMGNALPCINCLMMMKKIESKLGISFRFVIYSTNVHNEFKKERFSQMLLSPLPHYSSGTLYLRNLRVKKQKKFKHE